MTDRVRHELYGVIHRTYEWMAKCDGELATRKIRIDRPVAVNIGGTTHLVEQEGGLVVVVPAPGERGCVMSYEKDPGVELVQW